MHRVEVHSGIKLIITIYQHIGLWDKGKETNFGRNMKPLLFIFYGSFAVSLGAGALTSDNVEDSAFLPVIAIAAMVQLFKLYYIIWCSGPIRTFIIKVGSFVVNDREEFNDIDRKLNKFVNFVKYLVMFLAAEATLVFVFDAIKTKIHQKNCCCCE